jgi:antitoxin component of RelBE/YafQ-DinJ toxin-antitoxin module
MNKKNISDKKLGNLSIRLDRDILDEYKYLCERNGYDMSKRLRLFIEHEINNDKSDKNIFNI